jgi:hypothetical protein
MGNFHRIHKLECNVEILCPPVITFSMEIVHNLKFYWGTCLSQYQSKLHIMECVDVTIHIMLSHYIQV